MGIIKNITLAGALCFLSLSILSADKINISENFLNHHCKELGIISVESRETNKRSDLLKPLKEKAKLLGANSIIHLQYKSSKLQPYLFETTYMAIGVAAICDLSKSPNFFTKVIKEPYIDGNKIKKEGFKGIAVSRVKFQSSKEDSSLLTRLQENIFIGLDFVQNSSKATFFNSYYDDSSESGFGFKVGSQVDSFRIYYAGYYAMYKNTQNIDLAQYTHLLAYDALTNIDENIQAFLGLGYYKNIFFTRVFGTTDQDYSMDIHTIGLQGGVIYNHDKSFQFELGFRDPFIHDLFVLSDEKKTQAHNGSTFVNGIDSTYSIYLGVNYSF